ncbi:hypothetical protein D9M71_359850 [compost metagenome]
MHIMRDVALQTLTQLNRVIVRLRQQQAFDQCAFDVVTKDTLVVELAAPVHFVVEVADHAPPGGTGAIHRVHHRLETQGHCQRPLQQQLQHLVDGRTRDDNLQLAAIAGNGQLLLPEGRNNHPMGRVRAQQPALRSQFLLPGQRQAQAVAVEVALGADADGHVRAVLHLPHHRGQRL